MDEAVADIIRRLAEWREDTRATFEKLAAHSTNTAQDLKPDEVTKSLRRNLAFYGLATKYHETMGRLSRFFNENSTEEKRSKLPEVAWWQKLKKLFEIEESFYKDAKEAFAADSLGDYEIYSGLAKEALDQIQSAIEKVNNPSPVAGPEVNTESAQKRKAWPGPLGKVVEFYFQKEGLILKARDFLPFPEGDIKQFPLLGDATFPGREAPYIFCFHIIVLVPAPFPKCPRVSLRLKKC